MRSRSVLSIALASSGAPLFAHAAETDCSNLDALIANADAQCCNNGAAASTNRRAREEECELDTCTLACAKLFVPLVNDCLRPESAAEAAVDSDVSILGAFPDAEAFLEECLDVLGRALPPVETSWVNVRSWFMTADPGMQNGDASSGSGAGDWGIWRYDPGSTGVRFNNIPSLEQTGHAPSGWAFDPNEWWVEEHGMIMQTPDSLPEGLYKVTWLNSRSGSVPTVVLTVSGGGWSLDSGATLHDVTHMPCRSAVYTATSTGEACVPDKLPQDQFPVTPGAMMPSVEGCDKMDYAVLFIEAHSA